MAAKPEAAEALRTLQQPATTESAKQFQAQVSNMVSDALNDLDMIAKDGLAEYYKKKGQGFTKKE
ncbi:hypothetical protein IIA28_16200 [candidate division KSB1 bacterium]|nr:hypothetical protein [candidate division KSB1 bacterium]